MRSKVEALADGAMAIPPSSPEPLLERFKPFPVEVLPEPIRGLVVKGAKAIGCDSSFLALPLLAAVASAIGNTRRIQLKRGWLEPPIIWAAIIGESGTLKTPAFRLVMKNVRAAQAVFLKEHDEAMAVWENDMLLFEDNLKKWKQKNVPKQLQEGADPPIKPEPPVSKRTHVSDTTVEALAPILRDNPKGILLDRDELSGWIRSFDQYKKSGKGGADSAHWLSMHNGEEMTIDRKSGSPPTIHVPSASVSITGGIQPGILRRAFGSEHRENGLLARLLVSMPPRTAKRWTEDEIGARTEADVAEIFGRLYELQPSPNTSGDWLPVVLPLTAKGREAWIEFFNAHARVQVDLADDLAAAWSKLEAYAARLALVVHCVRTAANDPTLHSISEVDEVSIGAGVTMSNWFGDEARRVYAALEESDEDSERRDLLEWIERKGGIVTIRDLTHGRREYRNRRDAAQAALNDLEKQGLGRWNNPKAGSKGGRPTARFQLVSNESTMATLPVTVEGVGFANNGAVNGASDQWTPRNRLDDLIRLAQESGDTDQATHLRETSEERIALCLEDGRLSLREAEAFALKEILQDLPDGQA